MISPYKYLLKATLLLLIFGLFGACSTQKDTAVNRKLQNISARYNYIYNSNILLSDYEEGLSQNFRSFDEILPIYLIGASDTSGKALSEIIVKAQKIIAEKNVSNYLDDAYMLLGKANFYQGNYFTATEYFDYVARTYATNSKMRLQALSWQARSQFLLNNIKEGETILKAADTTLLSVKKGKAIAYTTFAQLNIYQENYEFAIRNLKSALKQNPSSSEKSRWEYIIAQLYDLQKNYQESLYYFKKVASGNAPFEMYFNANLNKIRIQSLIAGNQLSRQDQILALLKDDKNESYTDQIYYQAALIFAEKDELTKAETYYLLSLAKSSGNQYQKGLSYLRLADLNFTKKGDYLKAKLYYDSAISVLPKTFPGYELIAKKSANLQYLSERFETIAFQDTLQMLVQLPEVERTGRLNRIIGPEVQNTPSPAAQTQPVNMPEVAANEVLSTAGAFYFSNASSIATGFSDFKRKWGNRKLEDNWRQSVRSSAETIAQQLNSTLNNPLNATTNLGGDSASRAAQIKRYTDNLPTTEPLLKASNDKIFNAYIEIASFYLQEMGDKVEAAKIYELLLTRFPNNAQKDVIFYSLYRAYQNENEKNATLYKNLVLEQYPNSIYAKTIQDPNYSLKQNAAEVLAQQNYNVVYDAYEKRKYPQVIAQTNATLAANPTNTLKPQYEYLKAIAIGRTNNVDTLLTVFNEIVNNHPNDQLITPLVREHIKYINAHIADFRSRRFALADIQPSETNLIVEQAPMPAAKPTVQKPTVAVVNPPPTAIPPVKATTDTAKINPPVVVTQTPPPAKVIDSAKIVAAPINDRPVVSQPVAPVVPAVKSDGTFTNAVSTTYYFVVNVTDASLTLSSSRFGIGQFNRSNFADNNLRHQLTELDDDQLIYVGNFPTMEAVKRYAEIIQPLLKNIMKVPGTSYINFIISKENFEKINSRDKIRQYFNFYTNSY